jgi:rRNA-processing protein FCF1
MRPDLRLYLRSATRAEEAIATLTDRIHAAKRLSSSVSRGSFSAEADAAYVERRQAGYFDLADGTEGQLGNVTHDPEVLTLSHTAAYYAIRQLAPNSPRAVTFIDSEIARQIRSLEGLRDDLVQRLERARAAPGALTILDTNVLLHHQLPDSVAWRELVGQESVRPVIPLRVIEELDEKKDSESDKLRSRARERLPKPCPPRLGVASRDEPIDLRLGRTCHDEVAHGDQGVEVVADHEEVLHGAVGLEEQKGLGHVLQSVPPVEVCVEVR